MISVAPFAKRNQRADGANSGCPEVDAAAARRLCSSSFVLHVVIAMAPYNADAPSMPAIQYPVVRSAWWHNDWFVSHPLYPLVLSAIPAAAEFSVSTAKAAVASAIAHPGELQRTSDSSANRAGTGRISTMEQPQQSATTNGTSHRSIEEASRRRGSLAGR